MPKEVVQTARDRVGTWRDGDGYIAKLTEFDDAKNTGSGSRVANMGKATGVPNLKTNKVGN